MRAAPEDCACSSDAFMCCTEAFVDTGDESADAAALLPAGSADEHSASRARSRAASAPCRLIAAAVRDVAMM